ncbi:methyltransferase domain-containing protein [Aquimarina sp. BL5]|uniref:methyltransferase n=1 Tax=Aquimarina sp. BL5 TaxID=1714860 RepID=UPI000E51E350|nr:methyltransferase [Aquimarina sp. BL5]AXT50491.1 methyltransferase domain-containing protein [Aquimarina sp. BL5]RKN01120.1 methyltransferase domain-containing protein [Aquimarina sp. BL5]
MRRFLKKITHPFLKLGLKLFYLKPRKYAYDKIEVKVHPDVFPPHLTLSTKILLDFIKPVSLKNKTFLELGCGSGIISLFASKKGAIVTSTDINPTALQYLKKASENNKLKVELILSNLFDNLQNRTFEYIVINPPYYPKKPKNIKEQAWFCGENFEYFKKLFEQLASHTTQSHYIYMILSEDCNIEHIKNIALTSNLIFETVLEQKVFGETNYIFKININ